MTRLGRAALVALLVLLMAATPLSAILSGGTFETWLPGFQSDAYTRPRTRVVLLDHSGLVRALTPAAERAETTPMALAVSWYGCGHSTLTFDRTDDGFLLAEQGLFVNCMMFGDWRSVVIHLWSPIDPSTVEIDLPQ